MGNPQEKTSNQGSFKYIEIPNDGTRTSWNPANIELRVSAVKRISDSRKIAWMIFLAGLFLLPFGILRLLPEQLLQTLLRIF